MSSVLEHPPLVNPAPFTRPVASLTDAVLHEHQGMYTLCLVTGKGNRTASKWYRVKRLPSDFGKAFRLVPTLGDKLAVGEAYEVLLDGPASSCTCPGHAYTGGCKHLSALLEFSDAGRI